ncbi:hypothetical protein ACJW30_04G109700 [Castanea mollissima]
MICCQPYVYIIIHINFFKVYLVFYNYLTLQIVLFNYYFYINSPFIHSKLCQKVTTNDKDYVPMRSYLIAKTIVQKSMKRETSIKRIILLQSNSNKVYLALFCRAMLIKLVIKILKKIQWNILEEHGITKFPNTGIYINIY